jgi:hypothetical protein
VTATFASDGMKPIFGLSLHTLASPETAQMAVQASLVFCPSERLETCLRTSCQNHLMSVEDVLVTLKYHYSCLA